MTRTSIHNLDRDERGSALLITLMVLALLTALSTTVAVLTINNLQASWRAQQAGAALNASDAGLAQAMAYLRNNGVRSLTCKSTTTTPTACNQLWGESNPVEVDVPGERGQAYEVWVEMVTPLTGGAGGTYKIHSRGTAAGDAVREVEATVEVTTIEVPKGIFARTINGGGDASVARESIFSTGCVYNRSKIEMSGTDVAYGIPVAVHSSQIITDSNGSGQYCPTTNRPIHRTPPQYQSPKYCNEDYPVGNVLNRRYDQDRLGGNLTGTGCEGVQTGYPAYYGQQDLDGDGSADVHGSFIEDDAALFDLFGIKTPALSQAQIDQLRTIAQSQGNYWQRSGSTQWTSPDEANAVMFFDLAQLDAGGTVNLNDITGFGRDPILAASDAACEAKSLIIIVEGGNVQLNSNQKLYASLFLTSGAPNGQVFKANGTSQFIGTIYADTVNLTGTADLSLDECFLANVSPSLLSFTTTDYRELDR